MPQKEEVGQLLEADMILVGAWAVAMEGVKNHLTGVFWEAVKDSRGVV